MKQIRSTIIRAGLDALYFSGAHRVLRPFFGGVGTIFMLHHVRPAHAGPFQPNDMTNTIVERIYKTRKPASVFSLEYWSKLERRLAEWITERVAA